MSRSLNEMTGKRGSSTLSFFSLTDQFARKNFQINHSPHPPMLASSKRKFYPNVIVQGHGAKKEKQMNFGILLFLFVNRSIFFAKGLKSAASTVASVHQKTIWFRGCRSRWTLEKGKRTEIGYLPSHILPTDFLAKGQIKRIHRNSRCPNENLTRRSYVKVAERKRKQRENGAWISSQFSLSFTDWFFLKKKDSDQRHSP